MKTHWRAVEIFTSAANLVLDDCKAIAADHSAKGLLGSGATAKRAVAAFDARSKAALGQILDEVAHRVEHRGRKWRREMAEVERALDEHIDSAPELLDGSFRLAKLTDSGRDAANKLIDWSADDLRKQLTAFSDGWTAPRGRPWRERNALFYALLLIVVGAVVGQIAPWVAKQITDKAQSNTAAPVLTPHAERNAASSEDPSPLANQQKQR